MIRLLSLGLAMLATSGLAETVQIRSGQHDSFSRLVLSIPEGRNWRLARAGEGYALLLGTGEDTFDTSNVFERITANRIANLRQEDGQLKIDLACDCHADAFLWRADRLVVDIVDGPPPQGSEFEAVLSVEPPEPLARPPIQLPIVTLRTGAGLQAPLIAGTFEAPPPSDTRIAEAERAIVESLARAASQGVFAMPSRPLPFVADNLTKGDEPVGSVGLPAMMPVTDPMDGVASTLGRPGGAPGPGLVLRTGIERAGDGMPGPETASGHCIDDAQVSIQDWGDDRDYAAQIADRRRALTSEFDVYPDGAIEDLARTYLFFGFGHETRQVLRLDGRWSRERMILDAMSHTVDGAPEESAVLQDQLDCDGFVVLWAALSAESLDAVGDTGRNAAIMAFRVLPDSLRGHLGADLAQLFVAAGDPVTADIVLSAARVIEGGLDVGAALTSAAVAEELDGPQAAIDALDTLADENTRMTPEGLSRLIELQLEQGQAVDAALLDLAAVLRFEAGDSKAARDLARAEIEAHLARGDFAVAMDIANDDTVPFADADRGAALSSIYVALAQRQGDAAFLSVAFDGLPQVLDAKAENAMAGRLIALGFPERAMDLLSGPAMQDAMAERRYLRAEAAAGMNDLAAVERALSGLSDPRATEIRSRALSASGDYESAFALDMLMSNDVADPGEAWRAGAWTLLEAGDDPLLQNASRAILTEAGSFAASPTLAERRSLLERSEATRTMTEALLGRFAVEAGE